MPPPPPPLTFRSISRTHLSTRWLVQTTGSVFCVSQRARRSWRAWELENRESVEDMRDTRRSRVEGSSMVIVGSSASLCGRHPQLPEPHRLCCEKQKNLPPRVQGTGCGGWREKSLSTYSVSQACSISAPEMRAGAEWRFVETLPMKGRLLGSMHPGLKYHLWVL